GGVHGANRLSGNAMLEILVFGERSGAAAAAYAKGRGVADAPENGDAFEDVHRILGGYQGGERIAAVRRELQERMWEYIGPVRCAAGLEAALAHVQALRQSQGQWRATDSKRENNRELWDALGLKNMVDMLEMTAAAAKMREESRASHFLKEYPDMREAWRGSLLQTRGQVPQFVKSASGGCK
ncbi:hypothetical protein LJC27_08265, partial [Christensenellaceae bacterium OttesenSCG-928-M15]|nr:hypothetical protein [Christensenellaceae bacterium OttesenSCG-928-M15]